MNVNAISNASEPSPAITASGVAPSAGLAAASEAQNRFLKLLVTQLQNQDPLNPMDNAQITSQMAQINTVTGIERLNQTMQQMAASFNAGQALQATTMIGRQVLVPGSTVQLQNGVAHGALELPQAADSVLVTIRDASGIAMQRVDLGAQPEGLISFQWDGVTQNGAAAASGNYGFTVEALQGGKKIDASALTQGLVGGVTQAKAGVTLNVVGVGPVPLSAVRQVL